MADLLEVRSLSFSYKSWTTAPQKTVIKDLSLSLKEGEKMLVLAPFDAGKSTLARILAGLCPKYLEGTMTGTVFLGGEDIRTKQPWDLVEKVAYVSQNPQEQFVASSVEDELAFPLESLGIERGEMHQRVLQAIRRWGLDPLAEASEAELSGGERKRVLLALSEMLNPRLWILDESYDDLDSSWRTFLTATIRESEKGIIVLASRFLPQFENLFDHYLLLADGSAKELPQQEARKEFSRLCGDCVLQPLASRTSKREPLLQAEHIHVRKQRESDSRKHMFSLDADEFSLHGGETITLLGDNGSGKSTFARLLCGLDKPEEGSFLIDGNKADASLLNRSVGYLFQNPDLQIFLPTVRDELSWSLQRDKRVTRSEVGEMVREVAELFSLNLDDTPTTMSYPKRKALQAAVYYSLRRPFYILDELDNALTYATAQAIVKLLLDLGSGILVITHDVAFASLVAEKGYRITDGKLVKA